MHADVERLESTWPRVPTAAYAAVPAAFPAHPRNAQALTAANQHTEPEHHEKPAELLKAPLVSD